MLASLCIHSPVFWSTCSAFGIASWLGSKLKFWPYGISCGCCNVKYAKRDGALAIVGGVIAGLMVFSVMLLGGLRLVKWLGLPQDVPEGAHYSPPAPPLRAAGNPAQV